MRKTITLLTASAMFVSGCAGREAAPIQAIQAGDAGLTCNELRQEISINQQQMARLLGDQKKVQSNNTAAVVVGAVVFFPALFFMNVKGAAKEEAKALQDRTTGLVQRHNSKGCKPAIEIKTAEDVEEDAEA